MGDLWTETLGHLRGEVSDHAFNTWLKPLSVRECGGDRVTLEVPNTFYRDRLQQGYGDLIRRKLREVSNRDEMQVAFVVSAGSRREPSLLRDITRAKKEFDRKAPAAADADGVCSRYTFSSFVVGENNRFAHAAALAVARAPGHTYNPLLLYGGVGLGKTHLLCAIGNQAVAERPRLRVLYRTAERFMNELIHAIGNETTPAFRTRYREGCDLLLIDDVQFLSGKERTQEEFFHTFNTLHQENKQIVMTSDRFPDQIRDLDERLRSRFESGLSCDITSPDLETRVAIIRKKAETDRVELPSDVAMFLAASITSNIRALEGALIRLAAFASMSGRPITLEMTREVFTSLTPRDDPVSAERIQKRVASFFNLNVSDLKSSRRHKVVALPRQVAMYLTRKLTALSFPEIGERFGGKDHTTVLHGVQKIERIAASDATLRTTLSNLEESIMSAS